MSLSAQPERPEHLGLPFLLSGRKVRQTRLGPDMPYPARAKGGCPKCAFGTAPFAYFTPLPVSIAALGTLRLGLFSALCASGERVRLAHVTDFVVSIQTGVDVIDEAADLVVGV